MVNCVRAVNCCIHGVRTYRDCYLDNPLDYLNSKVAGQYLCSWVKNIFYDRTRIYQEAEVFFAQKCFSLPSIPNVFGICCILATEICTLHAIYWGLITNCETLLTTAKSNLTLPDIDRSRQSVDSARSDLALPARGRISRSVDSGVGDSGKGDDPVRPVSAESNRPRRSRVWNFSGNLNQSICTWALFHKTSKTPLDVFMFYETEPCTLCCLLSIACLLRPRN